MQDDHPKSFSPVSYAKTTIYFRINREDDRYTFDISENGHNWLTLNYKYFFLLPGPVEAAELVKHLRQKGVRV
jgi:hypothetical protein